MSASAAKNFADSGNKTSVNGSAVQDGEEIQIAVPWGHVSGKWWGPKDAQPVIALHGWQDNAGTFDKLAPLLCKDVALLAIDLVGHGQSSHLPTGQFYYLFWEGIILLRRIVNHYKWDKVKILGHSLGGAIGFMYAATFPDDVDCLMCLDIASPSVKNISDTVDGTGNQIEKFLKYEQLTMDNVPCYQYKEMIDLVEDAYHGSITRESAEILMRRGMQPAPIPGRHYFSRDPRLKISILGMLSMDLVMVYASKVKCAYLNIRAVPGLRFDNPEDYQKVVNEIKRHARKFQYHEVPGSHHVHLNEPEKVAPIIKSFLESLS